MVPKNNANIRIFNIAVCNAFWMETQFLNFVDNNDCYESVRAQNIARNNRFFENYDAYLICRIIFFCLDSWQIFLENSVMIQ